MSWVDVIAQAMGAGAQGIAQQEQVVRQRKQQALDQMEQQRRQDVLDQQMLLQGALPGAPVDEGQLPNIARFGLTSRVTKGPDGRAVWAPTLEDQLTQKQIQNQDLGIQEATAKADIAARQLAARKLIEDDPDAFMTQPYEKQTLAWRTAGLEGQPAIPMERYAEMQKANDLLPYQAALARAAAGGGGNSARNELYSAQEKLAQLKLIEANFGADTDIGKMRLQANPEQFKLYQQAVAQLMRPQAAVADVGTPAATSGGGPKYGTRGIVDGQPAWWDGQGWVPEGQ